MGLIGGVNDEFRVNGWDRVEWVGQKFLESQVGNVSGKEDIIYIIEALVSTVLSITRVDRRYTSVIQRIDKVLGNLFFALSTFRIRGEQGEEIEHSFINKNNQRSDRLA